MARGRPEMVVPKMITTTVLILQLSPFFRYSGNAWISDLLIGGDGSWRLIAHADLNKRPDNKINTSPETIEPPIVYTQQGCPITINVPGITVYSRILLGLLPAFCHM